jgi:hypothetical protein
VSDPHRLAGARWRTPSGVPGDSRVQVALLADGTTAVRTDDDPDAVVVYFTPGEMDAFIKGVKAGEFDDLTTDDLTS